MFTLPMNNSRTSWLSVFPIFSTVSVFRRLCDLHNSLCGVRDICTFICHAIDENYGNQMSTQLTEWILCTHSFLSTFMKIFISGLHWRQQNDTSDNWCGFFSFHTTLLWKQVQCKQYNAIELNCKRVKSLAISVQGHSYAFFSFDNKDLFRLTNDI